MDARVKKLWVKALRSGKYRQGTGMLRNKRNQFCCLGVLCNLHAMEHPGIAKEQKRKDMYLDNAAYLPNAVLAWAGLMKESSTMFKLASMNDAGESFKEIAKEIEAKL